MAEVNEQDRIENKMEPLYEEGLEVEPGVYAQWDPKIGAWVYEEDGKEIIVRV